MIGIQRVSEPCGLQGDQSVEFAVLARNMHEVAQVAVAISWFPPGAVAEVGASPGALPEGAGLLAPFEPLTIENRSEFGMASLGDAAMNGEGELVIFQLQLRSDLSTLDPVEVWIDAVSLGPSFSELDVVSPVQAVMLTNFCGEDDIPLDRVVLLTPPQVKIAFSSPGSSSRLDGSAGETLLRARYLRQLAFAVDETLRWNVDNAGELPLMLHSGESPFALAPGDNVEFGILPDLRGDAIVVLDVEGGDDGGFAAADISVCSSPDNCASTRAIWDVAPTAVALGDPPAPDTFALEANVPNPFNPATVIPFAVPAGEGITRLDVFNVSGQLVVTLVRERLRAGHHRVRWGGLTSRGPAAASGVYIYRLRYESDHLTRTMLLAR